MRLTQITLPTRDVDAVEQFYAGTLGLPVVRDGTTATVTVGHTRLVLEQRDHAGAHHLAFTIPTGSFPRAKAWVARRTTLLTADGVDEFETSPAWNAHSVYFDGPDGQVLELIERRDLDNATATDFGPDGLLCVSEIGIAVPDVADAVERLARAGLAPYANPPGPSFAAVGDVDGLLILVAPGRPWMPTTDRLAQPTPVTVRADDIAPVHLTTDQVVEPTGT